MVSRVLPSPSCTRAGTQTLEASACDMTVASVTNVNVSYQFSVKKVTYNTILQVNHVGAEIYEHLSHSFWGRYSPRIHWLTVYLTVGAANHHNAFARSTHRSRTAEGTIQAKRATEPTTYHQATIRGKSCTRRVMRNLFRMVTVALCVDRCPRLRQRGRWGTI